MISVRLKNHRYCGLHDSGHYLTYSALDRGALFMQSDELMPYWRVVEQASFDGDFDEKPYW